MPFTLAEAAKATGTNKTTLLRAIKQGKISGTKDQHGSWLVEPAELHRVYPPMAMRSAADTDATQRDAVAEAQLAALREMAELMRSQLDDVREDRDHWRDQAQAITRQLADTRSEKPQSWWRRIAG